MKKVNSIKKKLTAFGLAICTLVTSVGVNRCDAMNNQVQQGQQGKDNKSSWTVGGFVKGSFELTVLLGILYAAYKVGALTFIFNNPKTAGNIFVGLTSLIGTGFLLNKVGGFIRGVEALPGKVKKALEKKINEEATATNETFNNITYIPSRVISAGATAAKVGAKCAVPVIKYGGKAVALGAEGLYDFLVWLAQ